jgi:hypothetical protein
MADVRTCEMGATLVPFRVENRCAETDVGIISNLSR